MPAGLPPVGTDEASVELVVRNLVNNAAKYGGPGVRVVVAAELRDREVAVRVLDDGPGLTPEEAARVFDLFYRSSRVSGSAEGEPEATVADLVRGLHEERIGAMVVSRDGRAIEGIVSERDVVRALAERGAAVLGDRVADIMTSSVATCAPGDPVKHVMSEMTRRRIRHLPVVDGGVLAGLVSIGDVVKNRLEEMETEANVLREAYLAGRR